LAPEEDLEFLQGSAYPLSGRVLITAQSLADGTEIALLEKAQQDGRAIFVSELVNGFIEQGRNLVEVGRGVVITTVHIGSFPFPGLAPTLAPQALTGHKAGVPVQPPAQ
jgi:hypothetical protein